MNNEAQLRDHPALNEPEKRSEKFIKTRAGVQLRLLTGELDPTKKLHIKGSTLKKRFEAVEKFEIDALDTTLLQKASETQIAKTQLDYLEKVATSGKVSGLSNEQIKDLAFDEQMNAYKGSMNTLLATIRKGSPQLLIDLGFDEAGDNKNKQLMDADKFYEKFLKDGSDPTSFIKHVTTHLEKLSPELRDSYKFSVLKIATVFGGEKNKTDVSQIIEDYINLIINVKSGQTERLSAFKTSINNDEVKKHLIKLHGLTAGWDVLVGSEQRKKAVNELFKAEYDEPLNYAGEKEKEFIPDEDSLLSTFEYDVEGDRALDNAFGGITNNRESLITINIQAKVEKAKNDEIEKMHEISLVLKAIAEDLDIDETIARRLKKEEAKKEKLRIQSELFKPDPTYLEDEKVLLDGGAEITSHKPVKEILQLAEDITLEELDQEEKDAIKLLQEKLNEFKVDNNADFAHTERILGDIKKLSRPKNHLARFVVGGTSRLNRIFDSLQSKEGRFILADKIDRREKVKTFYGPIIPPEDPNLSEVEIAEITSRITIPMKDGNNWDLGGAVEQDGVIGVKEAMKNRKYLEVFFNGAKREIVENNIPNFRDNAGSFLANLLNAKLLENGIQNARTDVETNSLTNSLYLVFEIDGRKKDLRVIVGNDLKCVLINEGEIQSKETGKAIVDLTSNLNGLIAEEFKQRLGIEVAGMKLQKKTEKKRLRGKVLDADLIISTRFENDDRNRLSEQLESEQIAA